MTWFQDLTGIEERSPDEVRRLLSINGEYIVCPDSKRLRFGRLDTPTLGELRCSTRASGSSRGGMILREVVADVRELHADPANAGAMFQVASQFNLLEMTNPSVTPENGLGIYETDRTQGPVCAICCGAGTIYRNYFAPVDGSAGQSSQRQIDCSADLGVCLGNADGSLWRMQNGYLFPSARGLEMISTKLRRVNEDELDQLRSRLRIGLQWDTDVTLPGANHQVSQAYCSALPVAYVRQSADRWTDFAKLILEAAYEATFCAAIINADMAGSNRLYLTLLGGGAFGNHDDWIVAAIERAVGKYCDHHLDVAVVSYGSSKPAVTSLIRRLR